MSMVGAHDEFIKVIFDSSNIFCVQQSLLPVEGIIYNVAC